MSFRELFNNLTNEQHAPAPARPITRPPVRQPGKKKPKSPLKPGPGINPKPKARVPVDVELFKRARRGRHERTT